MKTVHAYKRLWSRTEEGQAEGTPLAAACAFESGHLTLRSVRWPLVSSAGEGEVVSKKVARRSLSMYVPERFSSCVCFSSCPGRPSQGGLVGHSYKMRCASFNFCKF